VQTRMQHITGRRLVDVNDLVLESVGIQGAQRRKHIMDGIKAMLVEFGGFSSCDACNMPHSADCKRGSRNMCCICLCNEASVVVLPCFHAVYCVDCSGTNHVRNITECPICRVKVKRIHQLF